MLEFALGIVVTDDEYELLAEPIQAIERCMLLTNDYWSWPREREQAKDQEAGKVFNTVCKFLFNLFESQLPDDIKTNVSSTQGI